METSTNKSKATPNGTVNSESFNMDNLKDSAGKWLEISKENGSEMMERSVDMAKKYPVHTALGAGAVGVITGFVLGRLLK